MTGPALRAVDLTKRYGRPTAGRAEVFGIDAADMARAHRNLAY